MEEAKKRTELNSILSNRTRRADLMMDLQILNREEQQYKNFVNSVIKPEVNISEIVNQDIEDACHISIELAYYSKQAPTAFKVFQKKKLGYLTKLSMLDYLLFFHKQIPKDDYIEINSAFNRDNILVRFQVSINLLLYQKAKIDTIISILKDQEYPTLYYRLLNGIDHNRLLGVFLADKRDILNIMIDNNQHFTIDVKNDLISKMDEELKQ